MTSASGGGPLRVVTSTSWVWKRPGIGGTEIASLFGCPARSEEKVFLLWAKKIQDREWPLVRKSLELEQGTPEWLDWRLKGVGGSEVGTLMGANPWEKPKNLYESKMAPRSGDNENPNMARGKRLEPIARELYERKMGWAATPLCVIHDYHDPVRCSLDGIRGDDKLICEIKCPGKKNHEKFLYCSKIEEPLLRQQMFAEVFNYYRYQVLYQLLITGADACHFVSYCPDDFSDHNKFALIELYPEPEEQERVLQRVLEFWDYIERRECPPAEWLAPAHRPPELLGGAVDG